MSDDKNGNNDDYPSFLGGILGDLDRLIDLLEELDDTDSKHERGSIDRGDATIDYEYSVNVGLGPDDDDRRSDHTIDVDRLADAANGSADSSNDEYLVRINENDDEIVITADLPSVSEEEIDVSLVDDGEAIVIRVSGEELERVDFDRNDITVTEVSFRNQVLEVRVSNTTGENND